ncbi:hypothetical protein [Streptomyces sp. NPDC048350]|uniref:hypothetical protein n=1 Tax=Streptomyces sp. NPDC048350 TaxID=3365538 RepID=UPI0037106CED
MEGAFALALPELVHQATWTVYIDTPADIRLVRKALRKDDEGKDPLTTLRGYDRTRQAHQTHVEPSRELAQLIVDGTRPPSVTIREVRTHLTAYQWNR